MRSLAVAAALLALSIPLAPSLCFAQDAGVVPIACGCSTDPTTVFGQCLGDIAALPPDPLVPSRIVNDIFHTADGHDARSLRFGTYHRGLEAPGGAGVGVSTNMYATSGCAACACPGCSPTMCTGASWTGAAYATSTAEAHEFLDALDWKWGVTYRLTVASGSTAHVANLQRDCPDINDVATCSYNPAHGLIFDLGGQANRVAIFAVTDHAGACLEPFEWSVWLSDNADATAVVRDGESPDPRRWNRARLDQIFLQGWTRNPRSLGLPSDTSDLTTTANGDSIADSPSVVFSLPCGLTFRYVSVVSGNYGSPGPHCEFDSDEDEIDAVAGLNADNTAVCGDADGDGFRDAACGGNDCNDADATIHPGALETCATTGDLNCDGTPTACPTGTACIGGFCAASCIEGACASGFTCATDASRSGCVPSACAGVTCPAGEVCGPAGCQDPCLGTRCPPGQFCRGGSCADPCQGFACPVQQHCEVASDGTASCLPNCPCIACAGTAVCNATSGRCEPPPCADIPCAPPNHVDCSGESPACVGPCGGVTCPIAQACVAGQCVRDACFGVGCQVGLHCESGTCVPDAVADAGALDASMANDGGGGDARGMDVAGDARDGGSTTPEQAGCGCKTPGRGHRDSREGLVVMAIAAMLFPRRRHRRPR